MENIKSIAQLNLWLNGKTETANSLMLYNFGGYDFATGEGCYVVYRLGNLVTSSDPEESDVFNLLVEGVVQLPADLVAEWGEDDQPIWDFVMDELNLTEA